jgi:hypothetical protein
LARNLREFSRVDHGEAWRKTIRTGGRGHSPFYSYTDTNSPKNVRVAGKNRRAVDFPRLGCYLQYTSGTIMFFGTGWRT